MLHETLSLQLHKCGISLAPMTLGHDHKKLQGASSFLKKLKEYFLCRLLARVDPDFFKIVDVFVCRIIGNKKSSELRLLATASCTEFEDLDEDLVLPPEDWQCFCVDDFTCAHKLDGQSVAWLTFIPICSGNV